jgi:hypothetical protein
METIKDPVKTGKERMIAHPNKKKMKDQVALQQVRLMYPLQELRITAGGGETNKDYGKKIASLNFPKKFLANPKQAREEGVGSFTIGLQYETDHEKVTYPDREFCRDSEKYMYCCVVKIKEILCGPSLFCHNIRTRRVSTICGANTKWHTDALRGSTDNCVYIFSEKLVKTEVKQNMDTEGKQNKTKRGRWIVFMLIVKTIPSFRVDRQDNG